MKPDVPRRFRPIIHVRRHALAVLAALGCLAVAALPGQAQAPALVSVTPADGATGVGSTTPLVFVFDQAMDVNVPIFASVPGLVGSFETTPADVGQQMFGEWGDDGRTLTLQPSLTVPLGITVSWTLNPPGALAFVQIKSQAGVALATVSGSYSTGAAALALASVSPTNDATAVPLDTTVVFRFNQPMEKLAAPGGNPPATPGAVTWAGAGLDATKFTYNWSADGRQLFCDYTGGFPTNILVTWALNPAAAPVKLTSQSGTPLPSDTYTGRFTTAAAAPCEPDGGVPEFWGSYSVNKVLTLEQTSAADPQVDPLDQNPFVFSAFIISPTRGPAVTAGSLTRPSGAQTNLSAQFGYLQSLETFDTAAELETACPPGAYTLRFTQTGQPERVIPMNLPATFPAVPKITNFPEAQTVNAAQNFTLQWNAFSGAAADDFISLVIYDDADVVFQAPDACVPRELPATATSVVIPAGTFQTNRTYNAQLSFGLAFYFSTNTVPEMAGYGSITRYTRFTVATGTGGGPGPGTPATFGSYRLTPGGNPAFELTGTAGRTYGIQRAASVGSATWPEIGTVTTDAGGQAVFEDAEAGKVFPLFYRAVAK